MEFEIHQEAGYLRPQSINLSNNKFKISVPARAGMLNTHLFMGMSRHQKVELNRFEVPLFDAKE